MYALGLTLFEVKHPNTPKMELKKQFNETQDAFFKRFHEIVEFD